MRLVAHNLVTNILAQHLINSIFFVMNKIDGNHTLFGHMNEACTYLGLYTLSAMQIYHPNQQKNLLFNTYKQLKQPIMMSNS